MKKSLLLLTGIISTLLFYRCTLNKNISVEDAPVEITAVNLPENEDGIMDAQEMDFEQTKDVTLGYIPKNRLVDAYEKVLEQKNSGFLPQNISALTWTERGPNTDIIGPSNGNSRGTQLAADAVTSGRMRAIWVDLADVTNHTVWAGSISGGLWKSTDITATSAASWTLVNDFFGNLAISGICQDPTNTNIMYFGTGEKAFNIDAVRGSGIWKSTNHGATWTQLASTATFNSVSKILCDAAGNVYVTAMGLFGANGVLRSTDGGTTWTTITPTGLTPYATEMKLSTTGRLHVVCGYRAQGGTSGYRFTDNPATVASATWTSPTTTFPTDYNTELAVAGNTLYAEPANSSYLVPALYKSTDGGANWATTTTSPPGPAGVEPSILPGAQGWYDLAIGVDPSNPNIAIAGGLNFYRTTDGGATWSQITRWVGTLNNYVHADHHTVVWNGTQVLVGTDGGIFYSNNNGVSFTDRNDGLGIKQFYSCAIHPSTTNYFIAGAQDNGTHQFTNAGLSGTTEVIGGDGCYTHIDQDEPQYQFSAFPRSDYIRSVNSGASWQSITHSTSTTYQFINPSDYDDIGNKMYMAGIAGQYVRWENPQTGSTFTTVGIAAFNASQPGCVTVSPYTANRVFFGTNAGRVVRVDNANAAVPTATNITGSAMSAGNRVSCIAVGTTENNLLATFSNYGAIHVWVSSTGGGTAGWTDISGNLPDIPVRWAMFYPEDNTKAIIATEMGIYETNLINGAATVWVLNSTFPTVRTDMLQYRKSDGTLAAATHGRGLWTTTIPPALPYIRFAVAASYSPINTEATSTNGNVCRNYKDYILNMHIDKAPAGAATVTLNISAGTATQGADFDFTTNGNFAAPSNVLTFPNGATADQPVTIRVYNDAEIETAESFTLSYAVSGATDAVASSEGGAAYLFNISDNDAAPAASTYSGNFTLGTANTTLTTQAAFRSNLQKFRIQYLFTAAELNTAGISGVSNIESMVIKVITKNSTKPFTGFTINMGNTTATNLSTGFVTAAFTEVYNGNYSTVAGNNTFNFSKLFVWDGTSNVVVNCCFDNAPAAADAAADVVEGTSAPLGVGVRASTYSSSVAGSGCSLAATNIADARITATFGAASGNPIATVLNINRSEYVANNGTYYSYKGFSILNSIANASANLGCVSSNVFEAGNTWQTFSSGQRSQKVFEIIPTTNSTASYTVGLYFTAAELAGKTPANLKIAKTNAATMATANGTNTVIATTTNVTAFGTGYLFTANFTGFSKFFLVDNAVVLPVQLIALSGSLGNQYHCQLQWQTSNQFNLKEFEVQRSYDGVQFTPVGSIDAIQNFASVKDYSFTDAAIAKSVNYYRLKMTDLNGAFKLSDVIKINSNKPRDFVELLKNPVTDNISFLINNRDNEKVTAELFSASGQLISKWDMGKVDGNVILPVRSVLPGGIYTLRISAGSHIENLRITKL